MSTLSEYILNNTFTKAAAYRRLGLLREYIEVMEYENDTKGKKLDVRSYFLQYDNKDDLTAVEEWIKAFAGDYGSFYKKLDEVTAEIENAPLVVLYTPVVLTEEMVADLCTHLRKQIKKKVLFENRADDGAVGGCGLVWENEYYDFSLNYYFVKRSNIVSDFFDQYDKSY